MKNKKIACLIILCCSLSAGYINAQEVEATQANKVMMNLLGELVQKGVLSQEEADALISRSAPTAEKSEEEPVDDKGRRIIRVPYITENVKQQLRDEVRLNLREDVVNDVIGQAKQERWGVPGVLPNWVDRIKLSGDIRLRAQNDSFGSDNAANTYADYLKVNSAGKVSSLQFDDFYNTREDRERYRVRLRLGMKAKVTEGIDVITRLTTGNTSDPVSTNQTLGDSANKYSIVVDRAYLKYKSETEYFSFQGGRMKNPWLSTDLVWDSDINFDGVSATIRPLRSDNFLDEEDRNFDPFITFGFFPLKEFNFSKDDRSLLAAQVGFNWLFENQSKFNFGIAYYDYKNIVGVKNPSNSIIYDHTAPGVLQKGNTLYDINNDADADTRLYALASDYNLLNITTSLQLAQFAPTQIILSVDYVKNLGYDKNEITQRTAGSNLAATGTNDLEAKTEGMMVKLVLGWPKLRKREDWQVSLAYKKLERDAVLDAYTDSDFHLGGTDAKGWILGAGYGLAENTWVNVRWISADEIDGPPLAVDTFQLDLNAVF